MVALPLTSPSAFAAGASDAIAAGFHVLAIGPGEKHPQNYDPRSNTWYDASGWSQYCTTPPTAATIERWSRAPNANIGAAMGSPIGNGMRLLGLDFDAEDPAILDALLAACPPSPMVKVGRKGETRFFSASPDIEKGYYNIEGKRVLDVLAHGRQSVLPPSIHMKTGLPYRWTVGPVSLNSLPIFGAADLEALETVLRGLGWREATSPGADYGTAAGGAPMPRSGDVAGDYFREVNDAALAALDAWVPALALPNMVADGRGGFAATAFWRPSSGGRDLAARGAHLSFSRKGIVDFGDGEKGYTAIDVVVAAMGNSPSEAAAWLASRLGLDADDGVIDFDALTANLEAKAARLEEERHPPAAPSLPVAGSATDTGKSIFTFDDREANAVDEHEWLVREILSRRGASMIWGQSGVGKGFVTLELAACIVSGQPFFGNKVKLSGGVLLALGENSGSIPLRMKALDIGRLRPDSPIDPVTQEPMDTRRLPVMWFEVANLNGEAKFQAFAENVRQAKVEMEARHGRPLRIVMLDTVNAAFGFTADADAAVATNAMKKLGDLGRELDLLILAVHHAGKSYEAGETGSHAWRAGVEESISVYGKKDPITHIWSDRRVVLAKARDGTKEGWSTSFDLRSIDLGFNKDDEPIVSAIAVPGEQAEGANDNEPAITLRTPGINRFLKAAEPVREHATFRAALEDGEEVDAIYVANVRAQYFADNPGKRGGTLRQAFRRGLDEAKAIGLIAIQGQGDQEIVWFLDSGGVAA